MELATIFLIWLAVTILDNMSKRKKRRLPPPENAPDFEIPTIANAPGEEIPIFIENPKQVEVHPIKSKSQPKNDASQLHQAEENNQLDLSLTPSTVMNAFVLSEILGKPKALRRR